MVEKHEQGRFDKMSAERSAHESSAGNVVYNKSMKDAYADLLMERMSRDGSMAVESDDNQEEFEMGMIEDYDDDGDTSYYRKFKRSVLHDTDLDKNSALQHDEDEADDDEADDAWLDDNTTLDHEYSSEADRSFYEDYEDDGDQLAELGEESDAYHDDGNENWHINSKAGIIVLLTLLGLIFMGPLLNYITASPLSNTSVRNPSAMPAIQKQINHLYSEIDHRDQKSKSDFDKTIKVIINQFEKKIRELLPSNVASLKTQLESLTKKVNQLSNSLSNWERNSGPPFTVDNVTEWQLQLAKELDSQLPQQIPVVMNNSSAMMVIPELGDYLEKLIGGLIQHSKPQLDNSMLEYDLNQYVKEILANQFQYVDKDYFIRELNRNLQMNKLEIWEEMSTRLDKWHKEQPKGNTLQSVIPQQYSNILLKKLINQIYNTNQHQWEDDLDFATFAQGTKLLNHLTSATYIQGAGVRPVELLQDSRYGPSTYWQCGDSQKCSWAIRFREPLYLTRLSYLHGRFNNNLHAMNSAPQTISVYVKLAKTTKNVDLQKVISLAQKFNQGQRFNRDDQFIRIGQYRYSLADNKLRQSLQLPSWFIQLKPLVRSIAFEVDQNYGNKRFTSLRKFIINAVTQEDLIIMETNTFPLRFSDPPEYASTPTAHSVECVKEPIQGFDDANLNKNKESIPSFGQDELIS